MAGTPESVKALLVPYRAVLEPKVHVMGEFVALKRMMVGTAQLRMTDYHAAETFEALVGKVAKTQTHCNALYSSFARVGRYLFPLSEIRSTDDTPPRP